LSAFRVRWMFAGLLTTVRVEYAVPSSVAIISA
jgi:hypothetical protein